MTTALYTIIITLGFFLLIIFGMAIGFIMKGKTIKGSCGGITVLGMEKMCDCEDACDGLKAKVASGEVSSDELKRFEKNKNSQTDQIFHEVK